MFTTHNPFSTDTGRMPPWVAARNMLIDPVFYDVLALDAGDRAEVLRASAAGEYHEGGMLLVWPAADRRTIEYFDLSRTLCETYPDLDSVAVPGVGSSPLGAAAFARQVADAVGRPTVGIIAGNGVADVLSEALGGWFDFGLRNRVQSALRQWEGALTPEIEDRGEALKHDWGLLSASGAEDEPDVNTLLNIMLRQGSKLALLAAHSKGAMVVQRACNQLEREQAGDGPSRAHLHVVTFGCGVTLPPSFTNVSQYVGTFDALGRLNTPLSLARGEAIEWLEHKGHNLVRLNPFHVPVEDVLADSEARQE